jgi:hypothetical protein
LPSQHRLFIYVKDGWRVEPGVPPYLKSEAESYCSGDACWGVSTALAVPSLDPDVLFDAVVGGLGLYQAVLPVDWTPPWISEPNYRATHAMETSESERDR